LVQILAVDHCGHRNPDIFLLERIDGGKGLVEGTRSPNGFVSVFHPVKTDLYFMDTQLSGNVPSEERPVGKEDRAKSMVFQDFIDGPELRMKERFSTREKKAESVDLLEFPKNSSDFLEREIHAVAIPEVTMGAFEVAPVCDLEFKIPE
jgi:hypothetical protein